MPTHVVFLPGAAGAPEFWHAAGDALPADWRKTYLGWPGLGRQAANSAVTGFDSLVALVESHLAGGPVDLVAQSMGGTIALQVARRNPTRVRRLVLAATSGGIDVESLGATDWRPEYRTAFPNSAPWILHERRDLSHDLPHLVQPTLLLWGDADPISPVAIGRRLQQLLPNATLQIVRGGDHSFAHERGAEIAGLIARHLG